MEQKQHQDPKQAKFERNYENGTRTGNFFRRHLQPERYSEMAVSKAVEPLARSIANLPKPQTDDERRTEIINIVNIVLAATVGFDKTEVAKLVERYSSNSPDPMAIDILNALRR